MKPRETLSRISSRINWPGVAALGTVFGLAGAADYFHYKPQRIEQCRELAAFAEKAKPSEADRQRLCTNQEVAWCLRQTDFCHEE